MATASERAKRGESSACRIEVDGLADAARVGGWGFQSAGYVRLLDVGVSILQNVR